MSAFGTEVMRRLAAQGKDASWLHQQTGISHSTISNWVNKADVVPTPRSVAKTAKALGCQIEDLAPAAGYTIRLSKNTNEREQRRAAAIAARPRLGKSVDLIDKLNAHQEDVLLSMIESYLTATLHLPDTPEPQ